MREISWQLLTETITKAMPISRSTLQMEISSEFRPWVVICPMSRADPLGPLSATGRCRPCLYYRESIE